MERVTGRREKDGILWAHGRARDQNHEEGKNVDNVRK